MLKATASANSILARGCCRWHPHRSISIGTPSFATAAGASSSSWFVPSANKSTASQQIRLSKRISELDLGSRREADRLISDGRVYVGGIRAVLGQKVDPGEVDIRIDHRSEESGRHSLEAIVLNKPIGYVSGQPEHDHEPAIRLITGDRYFSHPGVPELFGKAAFRNPSSFRGFVPAGRLDLNSTGLLVFTRSGVIAKKLVSTKNIEKEYIVELEPAHQVSRNERERLGIQALPRRSNDLTLLRQGGAFLEGDPRPLRPCLCKWEQYDRNGKSILRVLLTEGRKHQIRRMCREFLGMHVVNLVRIGIGPVELGDLPVGQWRPLTPHEINTIKATTSVG